MVANSHTDIQETNRMNNEHIQIEVFIILRTNLGKTTHQKQQQKKKE